MQFRKLIKGEVITLNPSSYDAYQAVNLGNKSSLRGLFAFTAAKPYYNAPNITNKPAIHPDGSKLYFPHGNETPWIKILDLTTGLLLPNPSVLPTVRINSVEISPEANEICLSASASPFIYRYSLPDLTLKTAPVSPPTSVAYNAAYSPNGQWLAIATAGVPNLFVYNRSDMSRVTIATAPPVTCIAVAFSPDSKYLAAGGNTTAINLYRTSDWTKITTSTPLSYQIYSLAFSPDSNKLAVGYATYGNSMVNYLNVNTPTGGWVALNLPAPYNAPSMTNYALSIRWLNNDIIAFLSQGGSASYRTASALIYIYNFATSSLLDVYPLAGAGSQIQGAEWYLENPPVRRRLAGTVKGPAPTNASLARTVKAYDKYSGEPVGETISSAVDGSFTLYVYTPDPVIVLSYGQGTEVTKLFDGVIPSAS